MNYTVKLTGGLAEGPFNIYYNLVDPSNLIVSGLTRQDLLDGYEVLNVSSSATKILVTNLDPDCLNTGSFDLPSPTPTPTLTRTLTPTPTSTPTISLTSSPTNTVTPGLTTTPTATPTVSVTATPTLTPTATTIVPATYFNSDYTGYEASCIQSEGWAYSRLVSAPMATVTLELRLYHLVNDVAPGQASVCASSVFYETLLPATFPAKNLNLGSISSAIGAPPGILYDVAYFNVTTNTDGYIDLLLTYATKNLLDGYSNGSATLKITQVNGFSITNGDVLEAKYLCTNLGDC